MRWPTRVSTRYPHESMGDQPATASIENHIARLNQVRRRVFDAQHVGRLDRRQHAASRRAKCQRTESDKRSAKSAAAARSMQAAEHADDAEC